MKKKLAILSIVILVLAALIAGNRLVRAEGMAASSVTLVGT